MNVNVNVNNINVNVHKVIDLQVTGWDETCQLIKLSSVIILIANQTFDQSINSSIKSQSLQPS